VLSESSPPTRLATLALALALAVGVIGLVPRPGVAAAPPDRSEQLRFMWAMAGQESGWSYYARNASSGAFGKYQIMPFNWPVWAEKYLGDREADQTPYNQEKVAFGRLRDLYRWLGSWKRVAYWWLTGRSEKEEKKWSGYAKSYVRNIMQARKRAPAGLTRMPPKTSSTAARGDWRRSARTQKLRLTVEGRAWPARGKVRDGQVLKVRGNKRTADGTRWVRVVTADGRLGWLLQSLTLPAARPSSPKRWNDAKDEGASLDRRQVRPKPR
jgi:hypothetical protein